MTLNMELEDCLLHVMASLLKTTLIIIHEFRAKGHSPPPPNLPLYIQGSHHGGERRWCGRRGKVVWGGRRGRWCGVGGEGRWCGRRGKVVWEEHGESNSSSPLPMTHHICNLIFFPCSSMFFVLKSTPIIKLHIMIKTQPFHHMVPFTTCPTWLLVPLPLPNDHHIGAITYMYLYTMSTHKHSPIPYHPPATQ